MKPSAKLIIRLFLSCLAYFVSSVETIQAQGYLLRYPGTSTSYYDASGKLGIGTTSPSALIHIKQTNFATNPVFRTQVLNTTGSMLGSIEHLLSIDNQLYGIYQINGQSNLINYFQSPVKICYATLRSAGDSLSAISFDQSINGFKFIFNPGPDPWDPVTPVSIDLSGLTVSGKLKTDDFQMTNGAGAGKVCISDRDGNASWTDPPSSVISPWKIVENNIVSDSTFENVGIGTYRPKKKLDIHHEDTPGGISVTQMLIDTLNGSEISFHKNTDEGILSQFSMGHGYFDGRSSFFIWSCLDTNKVLGKTNHSRSGGKTEFYMDLNNGMTGIGTEWPNATLEVAGDMKVKDKLGIGCTPPSDEIYKVFVEGGIEARKIRVTAKDYPDFCFNEEYPLMPLRDLKKFISLNKHLPGVPTAREVEDNKGIEIGEMQTILLKKVEEQTLYILDLQKQIEELKAQVGSLTEK